MNFNTLVFDLDGTIADTSRDIANAVNYTREHYNLKKLTVNQVLTFVGSGIGQLIEDAILKDLKDTNVSKEEANKLTTDYYIEHLLEQTTLYPGVRDLIYNLKDTYNLTVASNKPLELTMLTLKALNITDLFKIVTGPETKGNPKPEIDMLEHIRDNLKVSPEKMLMIGDSSIDIQVAKNFGCASCAVTWGFNSHSDLTKCSPNYIIHKPEDLFSYL